jgi:hypothetical protein
MPAEDHVEGSTPLQVCEELVQFLHAHRNKDDGFDQATADRLLLFALLDGDPLKRGAMPRVWKSGSLIV